MTVLPLSISEEIFDLRCRPGDVALGHLYEDLENLGLVIKRIDNYDHAIIVVFHKPGDHPIEGELRIDRIRRVFDISIMVDGEVVLPASGDWDLVLEYLQKAILGSHYTH